MSLVGVLGKYNEKTKPFSNPENLYTEVVETENSFIIFFLSF